MNLILDNTTVKVHRDIMIKKRVLITRDCICIMCEDASCDGSNLDPDLYYKICPRSKGWYIT